MFTGIRNALALGVIVSALGMGLTSYAKVNDMGSAAFETASVEEAAVTR